jgi:hypothetical protein
MASLFIGKSIIYTKLLNLDIHPTTLTSFKKMVHIGETSLYQQREEVLDRSRQESDTGLSTHYFFDAVRTECSTSTDYSFCK